MPAAVPWPAPWSPLLQCPPFPHAVATGQGLRCAVAQLHAVGRRPYGRSENALGPFPHGHVPEQRQSLLGISACMSGSTIDAAHTRGCGMLRVITVAWTCAGMAGQVQARGGSPRPKTWGCPSFAGGTRCSPVSLGRSDFKDSRAHTFGFSLQCNARHRAIPRDLLRKLDAGVGPCLRLASLGASPAGARGTVPR